MSEILLVSVRCTDTCYLLELEYLLKVFASISIVFALVLKHSHGRTCLNLSYIKNYVSLDKEKLDNSVWELRLCNFLMSNANVSYSTKSVVECFYPLSRGIEKAQKVDVYYSSFKPILHVK